MAPPRNKLEEIGPSENSPSEPEGPPNSELGTRATEANYDSVSEPSRPMSGTAKQFPPRPPLPLSRELLAAASPLLGERQPLRHPAPSRPSGACFGVPEFH